VIDCDTRNICICRRKMPTPEAHVACDPTALVEIRLPSKLVRVVIFEHVNTRILVS